jgi:hypothetical protein
MGQLNYVSSDMPHLGKATLMLIVIMFYVQLLVKYLDVTNRSLKLMFVTHVLRCSWAYRAVNHMPYHLSHFPPSLASCHLDQ